jgi:hypothetical protein
MPTDPTTGTGQFVGPRKPSSLGSFNRVTFALGTWLPTKLATAKAHRRAALRRLR